MAVSDDHGLRVDAAMRDLGLTDNQREAVLNLHGDGEVSQDAYAETVAALGFVQPPQVGCDERAAHARMAEATAAAMPSEAYPRSLVDEMNGVDTPLELTAILAREGMLHQQ